MKMMLSLAVAALVAATHGDAAKAASAEAAAQSRRPAPAARGVTDPRAFVEAHYRSLNTDDITPVEHAYSDRLRALFADARRDAAGSVGRIDFDYWSNSQDPEIANLRVTVQTVEGRPDRRILVANFTNGGRPLTNHFYFERVNGRWFLDDDRHVPQRGESDAEGWTLSIILKYGD